MAFFEEKWQKAKATVRERGIFMFNNDVLSDVRLVVRTSSDENDAKKRKMAIPAHKFVLSICSPVFFAMFYGEMAEKSDSVDLPDCEYDGVLEMLRYMYSEEVKINESNVMQVLYVSKKYILPSLADECIEFLRKNVAPTNVFCVLSHAQQYDEKILVDRCWEVIDIKTEEALKSEEFVKIERSLLETIVQRDQLTISEVELFKAVNLWATKECERQGVAADGSVKRRILGEQVVKGIRFPAMKEKEFASTVLDSKILNQEELCDLVKNFNGVSTSPSGFSQGKRIGVCKSCCRFGSIAPPDHDGGRRYSIDEPICYDGIEFQVDTDVILHGIRLFGSKDNEYSIYFILKMCNNQQEKVLVELENRNFLSVPLQFQSELYYGFELHQFEPVVLEKGSTYKCLAILEGPTSWYGKNGTRSVQCQGVTFNFKNFSQRAGTSINGTKVTSGQFAEILFKQL